MPVGLQVHSYQRGGRQAGWGSSQVGELLEINVYSSSGTANFADRGKWLSKPKYWGDFLASSSRSTIPGSWIPSHGPLQGHTVPHVYANVPNVWSRAARALKLGTTGPGWAERLSAWSTCGLHVRSCIHVPTTTSFRATPAAARHDGWSSRPTFATLTTTIFWITDFYIFDNRWHFVLVVIKGTTTAAGRR